MANYSNLSMVPGFTGATDEATHITSVSDLMAWDNTS